MDLNDQLPRSELLSQPSFTRLLPILQKYEVTTYDILTKTINELTLLTSKPGKKTQSEIPISNFIALKRVLNREFGKMINIKPWEVQKSHIFTTASYKIDYLLKGGIRLGYITEVSGESSSGKTQLLLQISLSCQVPPKMGGLGNVKAFYLCTESAMPVSRLSQILQQNYGKGSKFRRYCSESECPSMNNVLTKIISDWETQSEIFLFHQLPKLLEKDRTIKVLIIDSISHHIRSGFFSEKGNPWENKTDYILYLNKLYYHLQTLAEEYNIAVIFSNQVTNVPRIQSSDPLSYHYQLGWFHGWDNIAVYKDQYKAVEADGESRLEPSSKGEYVLVKKANSESKSSQAETDSSTFEDSVRLIPCLGLQWACRIPTRLHLSVGYQMRGKRLDLAQQQRKSQSNNRLKLTKLLPTKHSKLEKSEPKFSTFSKKQYFLTVNSVFGNSGAVSEAVITEKGYNCVN